MYRLAFLLLLLTVPFPALAQDRLVVAEAACVDGEAIALRESRGFELFAQVPHMTFPGGKYLRSPLLALGMGWYRLKEAVGLV